MIGLAFEAIGAVARIMVGTVKVGLRAAKMSYKAGKGIYKTGKFAMKTGFKATKKGISLGRKVYSKVRQVREFTKGGKSSPIITASQIKNSSLFTKVINNLSPSVVGSTMPVNNKNKKYVKTNAATKITTTTTTTVTKIVNEKPRLSKIDRFLDRRNKSTNRENYNPKTDVKSSHIFTDREK